MNLLVLTQIVDRTDRELGFFHEWLTEFATQFDRITVICLKEGTHTLPENVTVYSLGKERGASRVRYLARFFRYCIRFRASYDAVYIHMNQEYALLGGPLWRLLGKRVSLWRNHYAGSWKTDLAALWCHKVFCTSRYSFTAKYRKTVFMPVGVPDRLFSLPEVDTRVPHSVLSLGRIAPSKKLEQLVTALALVRDRGHTVTATICGTPFPEYAPYLQSLKEQVEHVGLADRVTFVPGVPYEETPELYTSHDIFVNLSKSGMLDKTMFEAMLSGTLVLTCNKDLAGEIREQFIFEEDDPESLAQALIGLLTLSTDDRTRAAAGLRAYAAREHTLGALAMRLREELDV